MDANERRIIGDIAKSHGGKDDPIGKLQSEDHISGIKIRPRLLASILRLADELAEDFKNKSFTRYLPKRLVYTIISKVVNNQFIGAKKSDYVLFFPRGNSIKGDKVINELIENNVKYIEKKNRIC